ncbi:arylesterase [uncultured Shimia sp.]|uniref:arylesterase n=1 Tax=uncultured Shimia sp. TaxID=573152 RepID=UPI00263A0A34|nr:arylesterase [uncultured Shimia sp.]
MGVTSQYGGLRAMGKALVLVLLTAVPLRAQDLAILAFGDSLTHGYGLIEQEGLVPQMRLWLDGQGVDLRLVNAGVSGDTTAGGAARIDWSLTEDIDGMILALGANDMLRGIDPASSRENLSKILAAAQSRNLPVLLIGFQASGNFGPDYKAAFDDMYPELAAQYETLFVPDFFGPFADVPFDQISTVMQPDGLHPNAAGVAMIVEELGPSVLQLVKAATSE